MTLYTLNNHLKSNAFDGLNQRVAEPGYSSAGISVTTKTCPYFLITSIAAVNTLTTSSAESTLSLGLSIIFFLSYSQHLIAGEESQVF